MQDVALALDQLRIEISPRLIVEGLAAKLTVGPETTKLALVTETKVWAVAEDPDALLQEIR